MGISFRKLSKLERQEKIKQLRATPVSFEEISKYDALVRQRAHHNFVRFWSNSNDLSCIYNNNSIIGKTGLAMEDLLQIGRMHVLHQIRYYKCFGDKEKYGASQITLIQNYLDQKFISLSKSFERKKRGGKIRHNDCLDGIDISLAGLYHDPETLLLAQEELRQLEGK